ncbi:MAG TPA: carboxypeptidase-like regulatory domain-containing protein [Blastocatellia bacterium]|nr:carboxypeptidase-like regulatory domain-containing protein [Blastocatellia bacterium]
MLKNTVLLTVAFLFLAPHVATLAHQPPGGPAQKPSTARARADKDARADAARSIKGRVTDDTGQPVEDAMVYMLPAGTMSAQGSVELLNIRPTSTDEEGKFEIDNVRSGAYSLMAFAPGYVGVAGSSPDGVQQYYRPGEFVSVRLVKGGVITGTVTNEIGDPMVAARVRAVRVRDAEGRPARARISTPDQMKDDWKTDDRGQYRIYGLEPGSYLVSTGGKMLMAFQDGAYAGDAATYYPSSTRDTATEVKVAGGQETVGVDIRHRGARGYAVSGTVTGGPTSSTMGAIIITLLQASGGATEAMTYVPMMLPTRSFAFYGVADGEYYLTAMATEGKSAHAAAARRVKVKGGDMTGIELALAPLGSVAGRVTIEAVEREAKPECKPSRSTTAGELVLLARRDAKGDKPTAFLPFEFLPSSMDSVPDDKGAFTIANLEPARYHIETRLPDEALYVRAITMEGASAGPKSAGPQNGIRLKQGERVAGLVVTVAEGASGLAGKIASSNKDRPLPARLRAHLVPAEPDSATDIFRYREAIADGEGAFRFSNVAPGRYRILAREVQDSEMSGDATRPMAWDEQTRKLLRAEAETSGAIVELQPCRRVKDYALRFTIVNKL